MQRAGGRHLKWYVQRLGGTEGLGLFGEQKGSQCGKCVVNEKKGCSRKRWEPDSAGPW